MSTQEQTPLLENYQFNQLLPDQQNEIYLVFRDGYLKSTGNAWGPEKFFSRAKSWIFYGDKEGFVAVRPQRSGLLKLVGVAGKLSSIISGMDELMLTDPPLWGMVTPQLANILHQKFHFIVPPPRLIKIMLPLIPDNVFGDIKPTIGSDGVATFDYDDVGVSHKVFVANKTYFKKLLEQSELKLPATAKAIINKLAN